MFTCVADPNLLNRLLWSCSTCWITGKEQRSTRARRYRTFRAMRRYRTFRAMRRYRAFRAMRRYRAFRAMRRYRAFSQSPGWRARGCG